MPSCKRKCSGCEEPAKYCCPRCSVNSCSLACVKKHKEDSSCDGIRDKTAYCKVEDFNDMTLLSDYRFLEESATAIDNAARDKLKRAGGLGSNLPKWLHRLKIEAKSRGTTLKIFPACFTKRKQNSTWYSHKERTIYWTVCWVFPQANVSYNDKKISENVPLSSALAKYLSPKHSSVELQQQLMFYQATGMKSVKVLLQAEFLSSKKTRYHELEISESLKENLRGKTIVEYPVLYVIPSNHIPCYSVINPEIESSEESESDNEESEGENKD
ncbi:box C/D snoRNA protein 1 isoform X2 [Tachypleus tridentatus]|uniref:box C/D snoRNA protein 1 isoform X2 n=1 Tax=Tachypleus tridentatus TaxID=6853 RepID=UPI003FD20314